MSPATLDDAVILVPDRAAETAILIARWRGLALLCREIGMRERARFCEDQASDLGWADRVIHWEVPPCSA